ncbi:MULTISPECIES: lasso peptide biosynthesis PqqD family chaperone [Streptomyces]|uniref:Lasso peptide biosynthesis PqqD family chaperone n=1 Tax=Streptomyces microflavus TaxID=1919 RepID=A0A7H8MRR8_STRMI|nr:MULTISPECIES: lasso peptide biosynthesis PqqD family chaperone [Streptomyces]MBK5997097.1 lasso peptide biosynthesis PqqD family chaperone [Streptomyces sp. MBT58]MBW3360150.1 lasso peptide biosynthesis PqqD family chaperone [Streptomyces sp. 09ZI22]QKW44534.1 lasso peptide biosynthesis PqqD family chaperone [Streptomyces microflavus]
MKLRKGIAVTTTEYGGVLLDEKDGSYWQLNDTSIIVVETLAAGRTPEAAVERIVAEFDVERAEAEADVAQLTQQLVEAKILRP